MLETKPGKFMLKFLCWVRVGEGIIQAVDSRQGGLLGIVRLCPSLPSPLVFSNSDIDVHQYSLHNIWIKGAVSAKLSATGSFDNQRFYKSLVNDDLSRQAS